MAYVLETATVAGGQRLHDHLALLHLDAPALAAQARPGQFVMVQCSDPDYAATDPFLPRPYFVLGADPAAGRASLLVQRRGRGSAWLGGRQTGDRVRLHGPAGREVRPARLTRHLLLLADSVPALAGLTFLAGQATRRGLSVTLVQNRPAGEDALAPTLLPADVEFHATTPEAGGLLGTLPELMRWADEVIVAAPPALLETLAALRRGRHEPFTLRAGIPVQAMPLPEPGAGELTALPAPLLGSQPVPCGTGICGACEISTRQGARLFCREGPAFPLEDLRFDHADAIH